MGITDIFRPKHRHSDADVRADAVQQLGADQQDLLIEIAREDAEASVRLMASERIEDAETLQQLAARESDPDLKKKMRARAARMWAGDAINALTLVAASPAMKGLLDMDDQLSLAEIAHRATNHDVRGDALARLTDPKALAELARSAPAAELRTAAIARIEDVDVLRRIAVDEMRKQVALAALDRISDAEIIDSIAAKAKNKQVRSRARKWLAGHQKVSKEAAAPSAEKRLHAAQVQLVHQVEKLAEVHEWIESAAEVDQAEAEWRSLGEGGDESLVERFRTAVARYRGRREKYGQAAAQAEAKRRAAEAEAKRREARAAEAAAAPAPRERNASKDESEPAPAEAPPEAAAAVAVSDDTDAEATPAGVEADGAGHDAEAAEQAKADAAAAKQAAEDKRAELHRKGMEKLEQLCVDLEGAVSHDRIKSVERTLQNASRDKGKLKLPSGPQRDELEARYEAAHKKLFVRAQDLRKADEWQRWANVPLKEALIVKAEALLADESNKGLGGKLKALQAEWKEVGAVPHKKGQELWDKFKPICDQIYERVKLERKRTSAEFSENLDKKKALCVRAEELAESTEWKETAEAIKRLQSEWKTIGPVPRKHSETIWKRFRGACDKFFERRKPHLEKSLAEFNKNLEKKQAMCEKAEALSESDEWEATGAALRELQQDWRDVGHVPRKDADAINKRFRAACDAFFKRREDAQARERDAAIEAVRSQLDKVNALVASDEVDDAALSADTLAMRSAYFALGRLRGDDAAKLRAEVEAASLGALEKSAPAFAGTDLDIDVSMKRKSKLCQRAEELAPAGGVVGKASVSDDPAVLAERLRAAMAGNTFSDVGDPAGGSVKEQIAELRDSWARLGPVPGSPGRDLEAQFRSACERALSAVQK